MSDEIEANPPPTEAVVDADIEMPVSDLGPAATIPPADLLADTVCDNPPLNASSAFHESVALDDPEAGTETLPTDAENAPVPADTDTTPETFNDEDVNSKKKRFNWGAQTSSFVSKGSSFRRWIASDRRGQLLLGLCMMVVVTICIGVPTLVGVLSYSALSARDAMHSLMQTEHMLGAVIIPAPAYSGELFPYGKVTLRFGNDNIFLVSFNMQGLESICSNCRFSITTDTACTTETGKNHLFDHTITTPAFGESVFGRSLYSANAGISTSSVFLYTGLDMESTAGHAFLVYDSKNSPLACGVLEKEVLPKTGHKYFATMTGIGASYSTIVAGVVETAFYPDNSFRATIDVQGVPPSCATCLVVVHDGGCANLGGQYWNQNLLALDPWTRTNGARYISDATGLVAGHTFWMNDGYDFGEHHGKVLVMTDASGNAIACGELSSRKGSFSAPTLPETKVQVIRTGP
jgi:hypothetical protein